MKKLHFIGCTLCAVVVVASCTPKMPHKSQKELGKEIEIGIPIKNEFTKDTPKEYRVVSSGTSSDYNVAQSIAITNARGLLVTKLKAAVKTAMENYTKQYATNSETNLVDRQLNQVFEQSITTFSEGTLTNVTELQNEVTRNSKNYEYTYWIALGVSKEQVLESLVKNADKISADKKKEINYDRDQFRKRIEEYL